jgi:hypothetical protein
MKKYIKVIQGNTGSETILVEVDGDVVNVFNNGDTYAEVPLVELSSVLSQIEVEANDRLCWEDDDLLTKVFDTQGYQQIQ